MISLMMKQLHVKVCFTKKKHCDRGIMLHLFKFFYDNGYFNGWKLYIYNINSLTNGLRTVLFLYLDSSIATFCYKKVTVYFIKSF